MELDAKKWNRATKCKNATLTPCLIGNGIQKYWKELFGVEFEFYFCNINGEIFYWKDSSKKLQEHIKSNPIKIMREYLKVITRLHEEFYDKSITLKGFKTDAEMKNAFKEWLEAYSKILSTIIMPIEMDSILIGLIEEELKKTIGPKKLDEVINTLLIANDETETLKEKKELLQISSIIQENQELRKVFEKSNESLLQAIKEHQKKFAWTGMRLLLGKPVDLNYFLGRIKNEIKENPREKYGELVSVRQREEKNAIIALEELNASTNLKELVALMQKNIFIRTWRLEQINKSVYASLDLINKFAESLGTNYETLIYLTPKELQELEHSRENIENCVERVKTRRKGYAFIFDGDGTRVYTGKEIHEMQSALEQKADEATIVIGQCASKGRAKGIVKIINDASELGKIKKGDVLVTQMTTPDFIVAMEKAVAIVTEIGGITCHAAIISRELGIPCVIGTKTATKTLKDGDFVEVNADEGKVKIIKSAD